MKLFFATILCLFISIGNAQVDVSLIKKISIDTENFVGCDYDFNFYYFTNTILSKKTSETTLNYSNFLYGNIFSVDITNPLKIIVFYKNFNVVVVLDSQLNETDVIQLPNDISFATKGSANHLWLFRTNSKVIENYNFKNQLVVSRSQPLKESTILNMKSTENYVYLQTESGIKTYDYLGNFIPKQSNEALDDFQYSNRVLYTLSEDTLYQIKNKITKIKIPGASNLKKFFVLNNHILIFKNSELSIYSFKDNTILAKPLLKK